MKVDILTTEGKKSGKSAELSADIFEIQPNDHAMYLAVKQYLANQRQGTHKAREKSEVSGSTRKLHRQKGTGGSRKGSIKNPLFRSGGTIFGPRPRDYEFKLNRKVKELARRSALSYKAKENKIVVVEDFKMTAPKTKEFSAILKNLGLQGKRTLVVLADGDHTTYLSGRNIPKTELLRATDVNTYSVMKAQCLVISVSSLDIINSSVQQN